jgi:hypothetical protein
MWWVPERLFDTGAAERKAPESEVKVTPWGRMKSKVDVCEKSLEPPYPRLVINCSKTPRFSLHINCFDSVKYQHKYHRFISAAQAVAIPTKYHYCLLENYGASSWVSAKAQPLSDIQIQDFDGIILKR